MYSCDPPSIASKSVTMKEATTRNSGISRSKPKPRAAQVPGTPKPKPGPRKPVAPIQIEHAELGKMAASFVLRLAY